VEQAVVSSFLKEIAVSFRTAKSYPPGHPILDKAVEKLKDQLSIIYDELSEFSMFFLEQTVIFQDIKIDVQKNPAVLSMLDGLRKIEIDSLSFNSAVTNQDLRNLLEVMATPKMKIKQYGDAKTMLKTKGTQLIRINEVKFGVQTSGTVQVAGVDKKAAKTKEDILGALSNLKKFVEKGLPVSDMQANFDKVVDHIEKTPKETHEAYGKSVAEILQMMPAEQRLELFQNADMQPFLINLLSGAKDDFLVHIIEDWAERNKETNIHRLLRAMNEDRLSRMIPTLKNEMPKIFEHLAYTGVKLLLSDKLASVVTEDDLRMTVEPYFAMLDSDNVATRETALRSLAVLANRFVGQGSYEIARTIISRLSTGLEKEPVIEAIERVFDDICLLYRECRKHRQKNFCTSILEPFNTILSKETISVAFKKKIIFFLGETGHPLGLSVLFSMVWESGIYPEVRAAIVNFGAAAVNQAIVTLRDVEDYNIRMRLVDIMKNIGENSTTILLKNLGAPEWYLRRNILTILSDIGTPAITAQLEPLLKDQDYRVRLELIKTFIQLGHTDGLLKALHDESVEVQAEALRGLKSKLSSEELVKMLDRFKNTGDEVYIEVLKIIEEKTLFEAVGWIEDILLSLQERNDASARSIKELGIATLMKMQSQDLIPTLRKLAEADDRFLKKLAAKALEKSAR
jgi:HEAT repeat protein